MSNNYFRPGARSLNVGGLCRSNISNWCDYGGKRKKASSHRGTTRDGCVVETGLLVIYPLMTFIFPAPLAL
jgi:hypothetical protein